MKDVTQNARFLLMEAGVFFVKYRHKKEVEFFATPSKFCLRGVADTRHNCTHHTAGAFLLYIFSENRNFFVKTY